MPPSQPSRALTIMTAVFVAVLRGAISFLFLCLALALLGAASLFQG